MKPQVYKDERPAEYFTRFHDRVRRGKPDPMHEIVKLVLTPILMLFYRTRCIDSDNVPVEGPAIVAPNHFSFFDHFFIAVYLRRRVQFMAKSQLFKRPMQFVFSHGGVFPVMRGRRDEEAFKSAHAILARGNVIVMYTEGGRSRDPNRLGEAKPGIGRLALESGAPVVPSAIAGSAQVRNWKRLQFPKVTVQYGEPIRFERVENPTREQAQAAADIIFERIEGLYYALQRDGRKRAIRAARAARRAAKQAAESATARTPATG
ncbi:MAG: lysophospholipid acyltransferase family protein [Thermoleophilaceae bacterium]